MLRPLILITALALPVWVNAQSAPSDKPQHQHGHSQQSQHGHGATPDTPNTPNTPNTPYAGFEQRDIKSLSEQDLIELRNGAGWGLALAAELNGMPGPSHLLELKEQLALTSDQVAAIEVIYDQMQAEAIQAGEQFIEAEAAIEAGFREQQLSEETLRELIMASAQARAQLRYVHLSRHLETPPLLTAEQIARYNTLRGYGSQDPCDAVPEGHNPEMWRRHNQCED